MTGHRKLFVASVTDSLKLVYFVIAGIRNLTKTTRTQSLGWIIFLLVVTVLREVPVPLTSSSLRKTRDATESKPRVDDLLAIDLRQGAA